ncbi:unnamed protein product [Auanema sp. JU1783]|nr:unnamed protein product [Auanema sp. JU1783]
MFHPTTSLAADTDAIQKLLPDLAKRTLIDSMGLPTQKISNTSQVSAMFVSWHDICAYVPEEETSCFSLSGCCLEDDLEKAKPIHKKILTGVYGSAQPGEVIAIMGSSGAGKSTLLNILTHRNIEKVVSEGHVKINGLTVNRDYMRRVSAFVQQDDCFIGSLTVLEHLNFSAKLKMSDRYSDKDQGKRVRQVISELGLKNCANTIVGTRSVKGLSGGEKKRLSFASEILTSPPILFCDEPTSGLDSFLAFQVISVLKELARKKRMTILVTIHQPSSQIFELFDKVYLLTEGRLAFFGTLSQAENFWRNIGMEVPRNFNPSDHYIASLSNPKHSSKCSKQIQNICDLYYRSEVGKQMLREARSADQQSTGSTSTSIEWISNRKGEKHINDYHAGWFTQLRWLIWRNWKTTVREPTMMKVQISQSILLALLTGVFYLHNSINQDEIMNINGSIFQMITQIGFMFQFSCVQNFCNEFATFHREHDSNLYRTSAYYIAKNLAELPVYTLASLIFSVIMYWMSRLVPQWDAFLYFLLWAILIQNTSVSIGYAFACIFGTISLAHAVLPLFVIPAMAFAGFFINQETLPPYFYPLKYVSHIGYAFESLVINEWRYVEDIPGCSSQTRVCLKNGTDVIHSLSFDVSDFTSNIYYMIILLFSIQFIGFTALQIRARSKK